MTVYLVGAGPGDPGLLTLRAAEVLAGADVVVHDRLAESSLLDRAPGHAERIDVGKTPGSRKPVAQEAINALLVERGRRGLHVVRLKGGDPFVFGRGGEEAQALQAAGVPFEVVPGISSAVAVPAYAGVPVTHRGRATSFTVVTGHTGEDEAGSGGGRGGGDEADPTNWEALAAAGGTLVVLMGVTNRQRIAARLLGAGLDPSTPVAAVRWGTRPQQHTLRTTLAGLASAPLTPPTTLVIGAVAGLDLGWFERRPLFGRRVVVTRAREQASDLVALLRDVGADTLELPAIAIGEPADGGVALKAAAHGVHEYDWVVFTSVNGVERFVPLLRDARAFGSARIAAIGPGTAAALERANLVPDLVPDRFVAESLLAAFPPPPAPGGGPGSGAAGGPGSGLGSGTAGGTGRVLLPRAAVARDVLPEGLRAAGWQVDVVEAYRTQPVRPDPATIEAARSSDAITFASSSTVTNFLDAAGREALPPVVACIGPVTADTARAHGLTVHVEAASHTIPGLVQALVEALGQPQP